jgi:RNA polymerase sigma-70 factor (ECF subfamily)
MVVSAFGNFPELTPEPVHVGNQPALRIHDLSGRTVAIWSFVVEEGRISAIHGVVNPEKLTHVQPSEG